VVFNPPSIYHGDKISVFDFQKAQKVKDTLVIKSLSGLRGLLTSITPNLTVTVPFGSSQIVIVYVFDPKYFELRYTIKLISIS